MNDPSSRGLPWLRIFAEGGVIVASILLAFAIDAWWDGRKDRAQEAAYLHMLASDARETLSNNAMFDARADSVDRAGARLVRAYYEPSLPPRDSILAWFNTATNYWVVQPRLGTAHALVSTGDLDLMRDDSLRLEVTNYLTNMIAFDGFEQLWSDEFVAALDELSRHVDPEDLRLNLVSMSVRDSLAASDDLYPLPAGPLRPIRPLDVEALVRDNEVHRILARMNRAKMRMRTQRMRMETASQLLLERVDAALAALGYEPFITR